MKKPFAILIILIFFSCSSEYEKREDKVYYKFWSFGQGGWNEKVLENADLESFSEIKSDDNTYGKDEFNVYYENEIIPGADPTTFKILKKGFAIDAKRAYYYNDSIENSNPKEFEVIDYDFSKNHQNVFYKNKSLNVCSVDNFSFVFPNKDNVLGRWSKDGCHYFYNNYKVPSDDYKNIRVYQGSHGISSDKKYVYQFDKNYFETNNRKVFIKEKGIIVEDTIDIKTFVIENNILKDKFGNINGF